MFEITHEEMIESVRREIRLREQHYPRWVAQKKLTQAGAELEILRMQSVLGFLVQHSPEKP